MEATVTPLNMAEAALRASTSEVLLDALVQLTHQLHNMRDARRFDPERADTMRQQRALVRGELLRRLGDRS